MASKGYNAAGGYGNFRHRGRFISRRILGQRRNAHAIHAITLRAMTPMTYIEIGGIKFSVIREHINEYGLMRFDEREIVISSAITDVEVYMTTLRHEMIHAVLAISGISYLKKYEEEPIVRAIENIFFPAWDRLQNKTINIETV